MTSDAHGSAGRTPRRAYDALVLVSFGGPEGPDEVMPFLRRVTAGRDVPDERLAEVARHYDRLGGVSPLNEQNRQLRDAIRALVDLPVYWGNRNAAPYLPDVVHQMSSDGVRRALAFVTSAYGSYSGCRQYLENLADARAQVGAAAPAIEKLRAFYNHPLFVEAFASSVRDALGRLPAELAGGARLVFTAHSIPLAAAARAPYEPQLRQTARLVAEAVGSEPPSDLCWQSRSGPPQVPWLEPDVEVALTRLADEGVGAAVVVPIGFVSDHLEVVHDLDVVAIPAARDRGLIVVRAATPGVRLAPLVAALVDERQRHSADIGCPARAFAGGRGPSHDGCPALCCLPSKTID